MCFVPASLIFQELCEIALPCSTEVWYVASQANNKERMHPCIRTHNRAHSRTCSHSVSAGYTVNDLKCCVRHTFAHKQLLIKKPINTGSDIQVCCMHSESEQKCVN